MLLLYSGLFFLPSERNSTVCIEPSSYKNSSPCEVSVRLPQVIAGGNAEDGEAGLAARSVCFLFEVLSVAFFPFCAVVLGVWVHSDGTLYFSGAAEVQVG